LRKRRGAARGTAFAVSPGFVGDEPARRREAAREEGRRTVEIRVCHNDSERDREK
jgi:hypothetical protein